jgi:PAS domain S-box-containing protein
MLSCEVSAALLADGRVQTIIRDVSERRAAEAALRERDERFRLIARATNDAIWDLDITGGRLWWNEGLRSLFGYAPEQIGPDLDWWNGRIHEADRDRVLGAFQATLAGGGETWTEQYRFYRADGTVATVFDRGFILRDAGGAPLRMLGSMQDITARQAAEEALCVAHARERALRAEAEQRLAELEAIIDSIPDGVYIGDATRITRANAAALRMLGYRSVAEMSEDYYRINEQLQARYADSGEPIPPGQSVFATALAGRPRIREVLIRDRATGEDRVIRCAAAPVRVGGRIIGAVAVNTDVTVHKLNERALLASQALLSEAQRIAHLGSWEFDHDDGTLRFSDELYRIMGHAPRSFTPTTERMLATLHDDDRERVRRLFRDRVEDAIPGEVDFRIVRPDGEIRIIYQRVESLRDDLGRLTKRVGIMQDVTAQRTMEAQLRHQAFHDPLIGLPNRALFADRLAHALARARRMSGGCAVFFLDLDRFKTVNDSLGHAVGDQLLIAAAARLQGALRDGDTLARLGGDEFAVLLGERVELAEATRGAAPRRVAGTAHHRRARVGGDGQHRDRAQHPDRIDPHRSAALRRHGAVPGEGGGRGWLAGLLAGVERAGRGAAGTGARSPPRARAG